MKNLQDKYWFRTLKHFENKGYFQNGLTIPFLIGSKTVISEDKDIITVEEFLNQIEHEATSIPVTILKCSYLGEYVISLLDSETKSIIRKYRQRDEILYRNFGNLIIVDESFKDIVDFSEIKRILKESYQKVVNAATFSKERGIWVPYTETDQERLREIII